MIPLLKPGSVLAGVLVLLCLGETNASASEVFRDCTKVDLIGTWVSKDVYYAEGFKPTDKRFSEFMLRYPTQAYDFRKDGSMIHTQRMFESSVLKQPPSEIAALRKMRHEWTFALRPEDNVVIEHNPGGDIKDWFTCSYVLLGFRTADFKQHIDPGNMLFVFFDMDANNQPIKVGTLLMEKWKE